MDLSKISSLFHYEPIAATFLLILVTVTVVAACVAAYVAACTTSDMLKKSRQERLRDAALAQRMKSS